MIQSMKGQVWPVGKTPVFDTAPLKELPSCLAVLTDAVVSSVDRDILVDLEAICQPKASIRS